MKKLILISILFLISVTVSAQLQIQTLYDTTRTDGQKFVITYPYTVWVYFADSVGSYYSLKDSYANFLVKKQRIIDGDTLTKFEDVSVPLNKIGNNAINFLTGQPTRKVVKKAAKDWVKRKLNED